MANYLVISKLCRVILAIFSLFYASTTLASVKDVEFRFSLLTALSKNSEVIVKGSVKNIKKLTVMEKIKAAEEAKKTPEKKKK